MSFESPVTANVFVTSSVSIVESNVLKSPVIPTVTSELVAEFNEPCVKSTSLPLPITSKSSVEPLAAVAPTSKSRSFVSPVVSMLAVIFAPLIAPSSELELPS